MGRYVKAYGYWLAGVVTVLVGMYLFSRRLYGGAELEPVDED